MTQKLLISYYFFSALLVLLLLLHAGATEDEYSSLLSGMWLQDARLNINSLDGRNVNGIGTSPFICKSSCTTVSNSRILTVNQKRRSINPFIVMAATFALYGSVAVVLFWMGFAYLCLKPITNRKKLLSRTLQNTDVKNMSVIAASSGLVPSAFLSMEDGFGEYGIMSRRRIRARDQARSLDNKVE